MDLEALEKLIDICRARGVLSLEVHGIRLVLGPEPRSVTASVPTPARTMTSVEQVEALERRLLGDRRVAEEVLR
jgi:hypothetical protein